LVVEARSDVVGSLLCPPRLLAARERFAGGGLTTAELKASKTMLSTRPCACRRRRASRS
jgi:methionine synthase II (cobalamin-independent)